MAEQLIMEVLALHHLLELVVLEDLEVVQLIIILQDLAQVTHLLLVQHKVQMVEQEVQVLEMLICLVVEAERLMRVVEEILVVEMVEMEQQLEFQEVILLTQVVAVQVFMDRLVQELQVKEDLVVEVLVDNPLLEVVQHKEDLMVQLDQIIQVVAVAVELELTQVRVVEVHLVETVVAE